MFRCSLLDRFQISHERVDPFLYGVGCESISGCFEGIAPDRHLPVAMRAYAASVDDAVDPLAREDATVPRGEGREVGWTRTKLVGEGSVAPRVVAVAGRAVRSEQLLAASDRRRAQRRLR